MKLGDSVCVKSTPNHHTDLHRVYDIPGKFRWIGDSIVPRSFIGKVPSGQIGIVVELHEEPLVRVLFFGGLCGWISPEFLDVYTP